MTQQEYPVNRKLVYAGRRAAANGSVGYKYYLIEEFESGDCKVQTLGDPWNLSKQIKGTMGIGNVFEAKLTAADRISLAALGSHGYWANAEDNTAWKAEDEVCQGFLDSKKLKTENEGWKPALKPIREIMRKTNAIGRARILAAVIEEITR